MDWDEFEKQAQGLIPPTTRSLDSAQCWVGVLRHNKPLHEELNQKHFVWMISRDATRIQKVCDTYQKRYTDTYFELKLKDQTARTQDTVGTFRSHDQRLVLFQAVLVDTPDVAASQTNIVSPVSDTELQDNPIRVLLHKRDPDALEAGIAEVQQVLKTLKDCLTKCTPYNHEAQSWIEAIDALKPLCRRKRTIIGVVGHTGAGKSSVINALLGEEQLLSTSCMQACTAVVTEISWNFSKNPEFRYQAKVEFLAPQDWRRELAVLLSEFLTENGRLSREAVDADSDAGIAWAKFHAVYPDISRESLCERDLDGLMTPSLMRVLGSTKAIKATEPRRLYKNLRKFVESGQRIKDSGKSRNKAKRAGPRIMEYWPLIKVVKIYTKAPALSTGAVIVDLPGIHDSNAARSAVARRYMQQCTGLWIVAPITRAVDDKAAKTLMGESFKTQLKYDGGFSNVTFICSKTDDISLTEAAETLKLDRKIANLKKHISKHESGIKRLQQDTRHFEETQSVFRNAMSDALQEQEIWGTLQDELEAGMTVYRPVAKTQKRKNGSEDRRVSKKHRIEMNGSSADYLGPDALTKTSQGYIKDEVPATEPLQESEIKAKMKELRETIRNARNEIQKIQPDIDGTQPQIHKLESEISAWESEISHICISGRNEFSKTAIQNDFAAGIRELDQQTAIEEDEENFDPDSDQRNYDDLARALPVFCVSSRAYQQQRGRLRNDNPVPGFTTVEETGIPQLQAHSRKLTEAGRIQTGRNFFSALQLQLSKLELWSSENVHDSVVSELEKARQITYMEQALQYLQKTFQDILLSFVSRIQNTLIVRIFFKVPEVVDIAISAAPEIAQRWGESPKDGGLLWTTYRAVVRRGGIYSSTKTGNRDFNSELIEPIIKKLARRWERCFQNNLPALFEEFVIECRTAIRLWYEEIKQKAKQHNVGSAAFASLEVQLATYEDSFDDLKPILVEEMAELQRKANRNFVPTIASIMQNAYTACASEQGKGSHGRMKILMATYIETHRHTMFNKATDTVKQDLEKMRDRLRDVAAVRIAGVRAKVEVDCMSALAGIQSDPSAMSLEEKVLRKEILSLVQSFDARLEPIAKGEFTVQEGIGDAEASDDEGAQHHDATDRDHNMLSAEQQVAGLAGMGDIEMGGTDDFDSESEDEYDDDSDSYEDHNEFDYSDGDNEYCHDDFKE